MKAERLDSTRANVWTADSGSDVGSVFLLLWNDSALDSGTPSTELVLSIEEAEALRAQLAEGIEEARHARDYWEAQGQA